MKSFTTYLSEKLRINKNIDLYDQYMKFDELVNKYISFEHEFSLNRGVPRLFKISNTTPVDARTDGWNGVHIVNDECKKLYIHMYEIANKNIYAYHYGSSSIAREWATEFVNKIKDMEFDVLYNKNKFTVEYYETTNFIMLKYGLPTVGRLLIADCRQENK